jgi:membrane-associated phospholipid phosphatase
MRPNHSRARSLHDNGRRTSIALACAGTAATLLTARALDPERPPSLDRRVRRLADVPRAHGIDTAMWPLYPVGLPGGYLLIAHGAARWLRHHRRGGGPAIVASAWAAWLAHRGIKLVYHRERPRRRNRKRRYDSYPSGHTTAVTAVAFTSANVLRRQGMISTGTAATLAIGAPALMGAYRVIADDHWATDVIGGWTLGLAVGLACTVGYPSSRRPKRRR